MSQLQFTSVNVYKNLNQGGRDKQGTVFCLPGTWASGRRGQRAVCPQHCPNTSRPVQRVSRNTHHMYGNPLQTCCRWLQTKGEGSPVYTTVQKSPSLEDWKLHIHWPWLHPCTASHISYGCTVLNVWLGTNVILIHLCWRRLLGGFDLWLTFQSWTYHSHSGSHFPGSRLEGKA